MNAAHPEHREENSRGMTRIVSKKPQVLRATDVSSQTVPLGNKDKSPGFYWMQSHQV